MNSGLAWSQRFKVVASDAASSDNFGYSVAIYDDIAVIGSLSDDAMGVDSGNCCCEYILNELFCFLLKGSAYIFKTTDNGATWSQIYKLVASDGAASDSYGWSVVVLHDIVVVSAPYDDDKGSASGMHKFLT